MSTLNEWTVSGVTSQPAPPTGSACARTRHDCLPPVPLARRRHAQAGSFTLFFHDIHADGRHLVVVIMDQGRHIDCFLSLHRGQKSLVPVAGAVGPPQSVAVHAAGTITVKHILCVEASTLLASTSGKFDFEAGLLQALIDFQPSVRGGSRSMIR